MYLWSANYNGVSCGVISNEAGFIITTAPILRIFRDQPLNNLRSWLDKNNGVLQFISEEG